MPVSDRTAPARIDQYGELLESTIEVLHLPEEIFERARNLGRQIGEQLALVDELARQRRQAIAELRAVGLLQRKVAEGLGVHYTRVCQLERDNRRSRRVEVSAHHEIIRLDH